MSVVNPETNREISREGATYKSLIRAGYKDRGEGKRMSMAGGKARPASQRPGASPSRVRISVNPKKKIAGYQNIVQTAPHVRRDHLLINVKNGTWEPMELFRKLNALVVLNKNRNPALAKQICADRNWLASLYSFNVSPCKKVLSSRSPRRSTKTRSPKK